MRVACDHVSRSGGQRAAEARTAGGGTRTSVSASARERGQAHRDIPPSDTKHREEKRPSPSVTRSTTVPLATRVAEMVAPGSTAPDIP